MYVYFNIAKEDYVTNGRKTLVFLIAIAANCNLN